MKVPVELFYTEKNIKDAFILFFLLQDYLFLINFYYGSCTKSNKMVHVLIDFYLKSKMMKTTPTKLF